MLLRLLSKTVCNLACWSFINVSELCFSFKSTSIEFYVASFVWCLVCMYLCSLEHVVFVSQSPYNQWTYVWCLVLRVNHWILSLLVFKVDLREEITFRPSDQNRLRLVLVLSNVKIDPGCLPEFSFLVHSILCI